LKKIQKSENLFFKKVQITFFEAHACSATPGNLFPQNFNFFQVKIPNFFRGLSRFVGQVVGITQGFACPFKNPARVS